MTEDRGQKTEDGGRRTDDRFLKFGSWKNQSRLRLLNLDFEMWIAEVKSRINAHHEWLTNQPNQLTKPNKLNKLTPREKSHAHTRFATCLRWSQGSYNAQVVCHFAVGHCILHFHFYVAIIIVIGMNSDKSKIITIAGIYSVAILMNVYGLGIMGWIY